jgi:hypothetical protein
MTRNQEISANSNIAFLLLLFNVIVLESGFTIHEKWYWFLVVTIPLQLITLIPFRRKNTKHISRY